MIGSSRQPLPLSVTIAFAAACVISAFGIVYTKHESRKLFVELQQVTKERDELNIEWGRLQIEQSTFATNGRIERIATSELALRHPALSDVYVIPDE